MLMRKINLDIEDEEYLDFLSICIEDNLKVEDKLKAIIRYPQSRTGTAGR